MKKVNVLGTEYMIESRKKDGDPNLNNCDGYCDDSVKLCVVEDFEVSDGCKGNLNAYSNTVMRHELIHAFLSESGLSNSSDWAVNEEIVDWIALQFPKLLKAFEQADAL